MTFKFHRLKKTLSPLSSLFDKLWDAHVVWHEEPQPALLYIDLHLVHEVTSPQAFEGLRLAGRKVRRPDLTFGTIDHNVPTTTAERLRILDPIAAQQIKTLRRNCQDFGVHLADIGTPELGVVHVIGPEWASRYPAKPLSAATATPAPTALLERLPSASAPAKSNTCWPPSPCSRSVPSRCSSMSRSLPEGVTAKDLALGIIHQIGTDGGTGYAIEYAGPAIRALSMEGRMTLCNMAIESGARAGMVAPDETTFAYLKGRAHAPKGEHWDKAVAYWRTLPSDPGAQV